MLNFDNVMNGKKTRIRIGPNVTSVANDIFNFLM